MYEITNQDSLGAVSAGSVTGGSYTLPTGYTDLVVQAPGSETVTANGIVTQGQLAIFGAQSHVSFTGDAGTGTIVGSGDNYIAVTGTFTAGKGWDIIGGLSGNDTLNTNAGNATISSFGVNNVIGLGGIAATVSSGGNNDLVAGYSGNNIVSISGTGSNYLMSGGNDTVYATAASSKVTAFFFGTGGGTLDFINQSSNAASITGGANGTSGSVTVFGGAGGGYYQGGANGNNSLVGGTGSATLIGAGTNSFLSVGGSNNALFAGDGTATLVGGKGSGNNIFTGGLGTDSMVSFGSGKQNFFAGTAGSETMTGSTVSGATNTYFFDQTASQGGGTDVITNFRFGQDKVNINPFSTHAGVKIATIDGTTLNGHASSLVQLSDNTVIKLVGVTFSAAQAATIIGGTSI